MKYFDFDGVILDTEALLFEEWRKNPNRHSLPEIEKIKYIQNSDWDYIINNSMIINDSIYYLKEMDPKESSILTKIHSLKEAKAKIEYLKRKNVKQSIILVPFYFKKTDIVDAKENTLVDDCLKNLDEWKEQNGIPVFFDMDDDNIDSWHQPNIKGYEKVLNLEMLKNNRR